MEVGRGGRGVGGAGWASLGAGQGDGGVCECRAGAWTWWEFVGFHPQRAFTVAVEQETGHLQRVRTGASKAGRFEREKVHE